MRCIQAAKIFSPGEQYSRGACVERSSYRRPGSLPCGCGQQTQCKTCCTCSLTTEIMCGPLLTQTSACQTCCAAWITTGLWNCSQCIVACSPRRRFLLSLMPGVNLGCGTIAQHCDDCDGSIQLSTIRNRMQLSCWPHMWAIYSCSS